MAGFQTTIIQGKTNHIDKDFMALAKDLLDGNSGIVGANDLIVTQSSPLAMSVTVAGGTIYSYVSSAGAYYRHYLGDATTTLTIDQNSSGSTRIDLICVKTDLTATPDANGGGVASLVVVKGTPGAGIPVTPANHYKLAEITVDNGSANIPNAKIADKRNTIKLAALNQTSDIVFIIDASGSPITTGIKGDLSIDFNCTIQSATLLADQSGSIVIDIWKDTLANYPPTVADTITASAKPTLSSATNATDTTLTGWTKTIAAGDTLRFNVDSATTVQRVTLILKVLKN
ncbi:MAG TPA: hypothetical protein VH186_06205 [Chloroflexia bacterium]|nr:hypothetical protein [Chloroflexia bacterium]